MDWTNGNTSYNYWSGSKTEWDKNDWRPKSVLADPNYEFNRASIQNHYRNHQNNETFLSNSLPMYNNNGNARSTSTEFPSKDIYATDSLSANSIYDPFFKYTCHAENFISSPVEMHDEWKHNLKPEQLSKKLFNEKRGDFGYTSKLDLPRNAIENMRRREVKFLEEAENEANMYSLMPSTDTKFDEKVASDNVMRYGNSSYMSNSKEASTIIGSSITWQEAMDKLRQEVDGFEEKWKFENSNEYTFREKSLFEINEEKRELTSSGNFSFEENKLIFHRSEKPSKSDIRVDADQYAHASLPSNVSTNQETVKKYDTGSSETHKINAKAEIQEQICRRILEIKESSSMFSNKNLIRLNITISYVDICSVILGKLMLPCCLNMDIELNSKKLETFAFPEKQTQQFAFDPREVFSKDSDEYKEVEGYLQFSTHNYDFEETNADRNSLISLEYLITPILLYFENIYNSTKQKILLHFSDEIAMDFFFALLNTPLKTNAASKLVQTFIIDGEYKQFSAITYEKIKSPLTSILNKPREQVSNDARIIFLDINYIEYFKEDGYEMCSSKRGDSQPYVEIVELGACHCDFADGDFMKRVTLKEMIYPSWCSRNASSVFTNDSETNVLKRLEMGWSKVNLTDDSLNQQNQNSFLKEEAVHSLRDGQQCVDERTAMENFCKFLESVSCNNKSSQIILLVCSNPDISHDAIETIAPLRILLSKIRQYCLEELFYKNIVGYIDLISKRVRQCFNVITTSNINNPTYFIRKKRQALRIVRNYKKIMFNEWPILTRHSVRDQSEQEATDSGRALAGLMCLLGSIERGRLKSMVDIHVENMKIPEDHLFKPFKKLYMSDSTAVIIGKLRVTNFNADENSQVFRLIPSNLKERTLSKSTRDKRTESHNDNQVNKRTKGQYICRLSNVPIGSQKRGSRSHEYSRSKSPSRRPDEDIDDRSRSLYLHCEKERSRSNSRTANRNKSRRSRCRSRSKSRRSRSRRSESWKSRSQRSRSQRSRSHCKSRRSRSHDEIQIRQDRSKSRRSRSRSSNCSSRGRNCRSRSPNRYPRSPRKQSCRKDRKREYLTYDKKYSSCKSENRTRSNGQGKSKESELKKDEKSETMHPYPSKCNQYDRTSDTKDKINNKNPYNSGHQYEILNKGPKYISEKSNEIENRISMKHCKVTDNKDTVLNGNKNSSDNDYAKSPEGKKEYYYKANKARNHWDISKPDCNDHLESYDVYVSKMKNNSSKNINKVVKLPSAMRVNVCNNFNENFAIKNPEKSEEKNVNTFDNVKKVDSKPFGFLQCAKGQKQTHKKTIDKKIAPKEHNSEKISNKLKSREMNMVVNKLKHEINESTQVSMGDKGHLHFKVMAKQNDSVLKPSPLAAIAQYSSDSSDNGEKDERRSWKEQSKRFWKFNS